MTNAEAIEYIKKNCYGEWCEDDWREAMDMAIEALKCSETPKSSERTVETIQSNHIAESGRMVKRAAETAQNTSSCAHENDLIFRQTAIDAMGKAKWAKERLEELSSAQPETPPYVAEIESEYKKWVSMPHINKPLAKALYEVWKKHDRKDVSRNG